MNRADKNASRHFCKTDLPCSEVTAAATIQRAVAKNTGRGVSTSVFSHLCRCCRRVRKCFASFHKHPGPLLYSSLLAQRKCLFQCLINDILQLLFLFFLFSISLSSQSDVWAYACTTVMLKGTAHRRIVMSLLETRRTLNMHRLHQSMDGRKSTQTQRRQNISSFLLLLFIEARCHFPP